MKSGKQADGSVMQADEQGPEDMIFNEEDEEMISQDLMHHDQTLEPVMDEALASRKIARNGSVGLSRMERR